MIKNYLKVGWRNIIRYKSYSILNIFGFAVGFACFLLMLMYTWHELTYDRFHKHKDDIYLIAVDEKMGNEEDIYGWTTPPLGPALKESFPEILTTTRLCFWFREGGILVGRDDRKFTNDQIVGADSTIFDIFTIPFIAGNPETALTAPNSVVLTKETAQKYFGDENPIGKTLDFDLWFHEAQVTGVVENYPENSHFDFDILVSLRSWEGMNFDFEHSWFDHTFSTYVLLRPDADVSELEKKFPEFIKTHQEPYLKKNMNTTYDDFYSGGDHYRLFLVPIDEVYLSNLIFENGEGKRVLTYAIGMIGFIIMLLALINYTNLSTALSLNRAREVGIRKLAGGSKASLFIQFILESVLISLAGLVLGLILAEIALPFFNQLTEIPLRISFVDYHFLGGFVGFALLIGFVAGIYPALILTSFKPINAFKGGITSGRTKNWLRNGLVIFQFAVCFVLIILTTVVFKQLSFMTNKSLGFDGQQVLVIKNAQRLENKALTFKQEMLKNAGISTVSFTNTIPGRNFNDQSQHIAGDPPDESHVIKPLIADEDILETLDLSLLSGQDFHESGKTGNVAILNKAAVDQLHLTDPLSVQIDQGTFGDRLTDIVGVVDNFHYQSFHTPIQPLIIYHYDIRDGLDPGIISYVLLKLEGDNYGDAIYQVESTWANMTENFPFEYTFLDADFDHLFQSEKRASLIYSIFSLIAVFVASLGLLGLAAFYTKKRTKEIGVRKIVGASVMNIITMLSADFGRLVFYALLVGTPFAWLVTQNWLNGFAYKTELNVWIFIFAGMMVMFIAMLTVSLQTLKAANTNPVKTLRNE